VSPADAPAETGSSATPVPTASSQPRLSALSAVIEKLQWSINFRNSLQAANIDFLRSKLFILRRESAYTVAVRMRYYLTSSFT